MWNVVTWRTDWDFNMQSTQGCALFELGLQRRIYVHQVLIIFPSDVVWIREEFVVAIVVAMVDRQDVDSFIDEKYYTHNQGIRSLYLVNYLFKLQKFCSYGRREEGKAHERTTNQ